MTRSATAAREREEPERWDKRMELQAGEADSREDRTVEVYVTIVAAGRESSGTLCTSNEQQSVRDMTLLLQHAERKLPIDASTSLLHMADCNSCTETGTRACAALRVDSAVTETRAQETNLNKRADP